MLAPSGGWWWYFKVLPPIVLSNSKLGDSKSMIMELNSLNKLNVDFQLFVL